MEVECCNWFKYIRLFCKFTLSKIYTKLTQETEGLVVITRCNNVYVNFVSLVEGLEGCKIIKLLDGYLYKTTAHNFDVCPNESFKWSMRELLLQ
jgi:hypothetical protein